jgi:hypothetical protein
MQVTQVGKLYKEGRTAWAETIEFNYLKGGCRYLFFLRSPHPQEIAAFKQGEIELSVTVIERVIFVPIQFLSSADSGVLSAGFPSHDKDPSKTPALVGDAGYSCWNLPVELREVPPEQDRYSCQAILIDADNGIVKAICLFDFPPELSQVLRTGIVEQIEGGEISRSDFERVVASTQNTYSPTELAKLGGIYKLSRPPKPKKGFG